MPHLENIYVERGIYIAAAVLLVYLGYRFGKFFGAHKGDANGSVENLRPDHVQQNSDVVGQHHEEHVAAAGLIGAAAQAVSQVSF